MDLDARAYRYFVAVADERSFTRAAVKLNTSQPALSGQIRELERRLGFSLFTRTSRHVELTSQGWLFLPNARRIINEMEIVNRAARDIRSNELRVGAAFQTEMIAERQGLMEQFMRANPDVPLQMLSEYPFRLLRSLERGEIDIAISIEPLPKGQDRSATPDSLLGDHDGVLLEHLVVAERPIVLSLPPEHPLASGDIPLEALRGVPVVVPNRYHGVPLANAIRYRLSELGAVPVRAPEGHAIAVERFGRLRRIASVALNWFHPSVTTNEGEEAFVQRPVAGFGLSTGLAMIRTRGGQRSAAERFWRDAAQRQAQAGPPPEP